MGVRDCDCREQLGQDGLGWQRRGAAAVPRVVLGRSVSKSVLVALITGSSDRPRPANRLVNIKK